MKIQILLDKRLSPIIFNRAVGIILDNKNGLRIIGRGYKEVFPLEMIKSLMVVENENGSN